MFIKAKLICKRMWLHIWWTLVLVTSVFSCHQYLYLSLKILLAHADKQNIIYIIFKSYNMGFVYLTNCTTISCSVVSMCAFFLYIIGEHFWRAAETKLWTNRRTTPFTGEDSPSTIHHRQGDPDLFSGLNHRYTDTDYHSNTFWLHCRGTKHHPSWSTYSPFCWFRTSLSGNSQI